MSVRFIRTTAAERVDFDSTFCERNLNLLAHAQSIELDIGSQCGGHGICGGDRIRLDPSRNYPVSPPTEIELEHLTREQIADGWRLACQCFPESNGLAIEAEFPG